MKKYEYSFIGEINRSWAIAGWVPVFILIMVKSPSIFTPLEWFALILLFTLAGLGQHYMYPSIATNGRGIHLTSYGKTIIVPWENLFILNKKLRESAATTFKTQGVSWHRKIFFVGSFLNDYKDFLEEISSHCLVKR